MSIEVKVPQLPESVADATLISWHKAPGDAVSRDESLVELETDKVVLEVPAPVSGVIKEIRVQNGATVRSGDLLAVLEAGEAKVPVAAARQPPQPRRPPQCRWQRRRSVGRAGKAGPGRPARWRQKVAWTVTQIAGSGRDGRVLKSDVAQAGSAAPTPAVAVPPAAPATPPQRGRRRPGRARNAGCP